MTRPETISPWVRYVRQIEDLVEQADSWTELPPSQTMWRVIVSADKAIRSIGQLLAESLPVPVPTTTADSSVIRAVEAVVLAVFDDREVPVDAASRAREADRIEGSDGTITVPLTVSGPQVGNWLVLLRLVSDRLDNVAIDVERTAGRVDLQDRVEVAEALDDLAEALRDTSMTVRNVLTRTLWLNPPDGLVDAEFWRVREYVTQTIEMYNPHI